MFKGPVHWPVSQYFGKPLSFVKALTVIYQSHNIILTEPRNKQSI